MPAQRDSEPPDLTPSAYMVMAMIRDGVDTGYRIKVYLERAAAHFWSISYGQIYPELRRLEAAALISGRDVTVSGRRRREFSLTEGGAAELRRWLSDPPEPSLWVRNESVLRLMLVDWSDHEILRTNLGEVRRVAAARLEALEALVPPRERGRRIQELGARVLRTTIEWCDETEATLGGQDA